MINIPILSNFPSKSLGVDIGTSSIKIVEISKRGESLTLENYGSVPIASIFEKKLSKKPRESFTSSFEEIAEMIKAVLKEAGIRTKDSIFAIPDFISFFTSFEIPFMKGDELEAAIQFQARQRVPLPLSEATLDWSIADRRKEKLRILLLAVPNEVIESYKKIAKASGLRFSSLEGEIFGLARALGRNKSEPIMAIDMGVESTTINVIKDMVPRVSYSLDVSGNNFVQVISDYFNIDYNEAREKIKREDEEVLKAISPLLDSVIRKSQETIEDYSRSREEKIEKVVLAGGAAGIYGLKDYFQKSSKVPVEIANPLEGMTYPKELQEIILELGPSYAVSVGMAIGKFIT